MTHSDPAQDPAAQDRAAQDLAEPGGVVVGLDGSEQSKDALLWALRQAALTRVSVRAVTCWEWPPSLGVAGYIDIDLAGASREVAQKAVDEVLAGLPDGAPEASVTIGLVVLEGYPGRALVTAAEGAELLVVGSRGRGALGRMLLGSVGLHIASHAPCPVVIVRKPDDATKE